MSSLQYLEVVFCFLSLMELTSFLFWVLCCEVFKFWVNSFDGWWNKEWQEPKLGDAHGTPRYSRIAKILSLWMTREGIPSFVFVHWWLYLELYFYSPHDMCFAWSVLYYLCIFLLVYHNHPCCTHLLREPYMN